MAICERCATESPSGFSFCGACGAPLATEPLDRDARKVVTSLFCDVTDSTALGEQLDPEALQVVLGAYFDAVRAAIERHGGTVQKYAGDAVLAVFGIPRVHEDDALRAVRAAVEVRDRLPAIAERTGVPLRVRIGVNTGLVVSDEGRNLALGDAVNVAARLEQAAAPGEILLGEESHRLVRDAIRSEPLEPLRLHGKSDPVPAHRLLALDPTAPGLARRLDLAIVDRRAELSALVQAWEQAAAGAAARLVAVTGSAGVGKSRLAEELVAVIGSRARVLRGRCLPYGEGITFWPIVEALTPVGAVAEPVLARLASGGVAAPEELFWEVRRLLESLAAPLPLVLYLDDVHWAEPLLVALVAHLVTLSRSARLLLLCTARAELVEERPEWAAVLAQGRVVELEALDVTECEQLLGQLGTRLDAERRAQLIRASDGNPLFLEEMALLAGERGVVELPSTIQALLAARLEQLEPAERELLARSAVEGQVFHRSAALALSDGASGEEIEARLAALQHRDLIRPHPANVAGDRAFRFRHLLIRDAAYEWLPKATRARLHAGYADWLERTDVDFPEVDEIAGWHLEQAVTHEREVHRRVDAGVARRAAEHLLAAGRRAGDRSDLTAARRLLERALPLAPDGERLRGEVAVALAERLIEAGELARADQLLTLAERDGDEDGGAAVFARLEWLLHSVPENAAATIEARLPAMLARLTSQRDDRGLAKAHWLAFLVHWSANRAGLAGEQARLSAEHADRAGDSGQWSRALGWYVATLLYGPAGAGEIAAELDAIDRRAPGPYLAGCVALGRAEVARLGGRLEPARRLAEDARERFRQLGIRTMQAVCDHSLAEIAIAAGDGGAAVDVLLRSEPVLAELGERALRSTTQAWLACAHERLGAPTAAIAAADLSDSLSAPQEVSNFTMTSGVRARVALAERDRQLAERWARRAVELAAQTDLNGLLAQARLGLADVLASLGDDASASVEARAALAEFTAKGDRGGVEAAQARLRTSARRPAAGG